MEKNCPGESEKQPDLQSSPATRTTYHFDRISAANRVGTVNSTKTRRSGRLRDVEEEKSVRGRKEVVEEDLDSREISRMPRPQLPASLLPRVSLNYNNCVFLRICTLSNNCLRSGCFSQDQGAGGPPEPYKVVCADSSTAYNTPGSFFPNKMLGGSTIMRTQAVH